MIKKMMVKKVMQLLFFSSLTYYVIGQNNYILTAVLRSPPTHQAGNSIYTKPKVVRISNTQKESTWNTRIELGQTRSFGLQGTYTSETFSEPLNIICNGEDSDDTPLLKPDSIVEFNGVALDSRDANLTKPIEVFADVLTDAEILNLVPISDGHALVSNYYRIRSPDVSYLVNEDILYIGVPIENGVSTENLWRLAYTDVGQATHITSPMWFSAPIEFDVLSNRAIFSVPLASVAEEGLIIAIAQSVTQNILSTQQIDDRVIGIGDIIINWDIELEDSCNPTEEE